MLEENLPQCHFIHHKFNMVAGVCNFLLELDGSTLFTCIIYTLLYQTDCILTVVMNKICEYYFSENNLVCWIQLITVECGVAT
jgi:hypothetical protein